LKSIPEPKLGEIHLAAKQKRHVGAQQSGKRWDFRKNRLVEIME
jgi:hypothetical protein